jgi:hypothetical protein
MVVEAISLKREQKNKLTEREAHKTERRRQHTKVLSIVVVVVEGRSGTQFCRQKFALDIPTLDN